MTRQRTTRIVAAVLAIVLVLAAAATAISLVGGGGDDGAGDRGDPPRPDSASRATEAPSPAPTGAPEPGATEPPGPALAPYYSQELEWDACGEHECAELTVPLDYDEPDGETIELAMLRVPAADPEQRVGSLVVNPGGPGAPGTTYAAQAGQAFRKPLLRAFDIVGFDPRGTGSSAPVDCLTDEQLDDYIATDPSPDTAGEQQEYVGWTETIGDGCVERSGELAAHVTTVEAARDMDVLRAALGEAELTYFGASYGTRLGATYAELFPDRVGRLVLDGAIDPTLTTRELNLGQAAGFERALRSYAADCVDQGCPLGDSADEVLDSITDLVRQVDAEPLPAGDRELRVGNAFYGIVAPLYNRDFWFVLTQALEAAQRGDGSVLLQLSDLYTSRGADGDYLDNSAEAIYAINCLDDPTAIRATAVDEQVPAFLRASPTFGEVFAWSLTGCGGIEVESDVLELEIDAAGADPILVIGTTRDPATPYEWAVALADQLESGVLVSRDGDGHTGYNMGNDCVDEAVESYLLDGAVPEDGLRC